MTLEHYYSGREQTSVKHQILERYLKAFVPIIGSSFREIVYLDCFAGPWESRSPNLEDTSFDRAIKVFRDVKAQGRLPVPVRALLVERRAKTFASLAAYCEKLPPIKGIEIEPKKWDFEVWTSEIARFARSGRQDAFAFSFIDPWGYKLVGIPLIRPLLQLQPGEVLITFMSSFVKRFFQDKNKTGVLEGLFGDRQELERLRALHGNEEFEDELIGSYVNKLRSVGRFRYVSALPVMWPDRDDFAFYMIYGTRHEKGLQEFKKAEAVAIPHMHLRRAEAQREKEAKTNPFLPGISAMHTYRETRFTRFHERRLRQAKDAAITLLKTSPPMTLRIIDIENEALQFPTVLQDNVREWIQEWRTSGHLDIEGWSPKQKVPHENQLVRWLK